MYKTIEQTVGNTPLVELRHMVPGTGNVVLAKLEGNNPAGSVKDRPALSMVAQAEKRGTIKRGDTLIEATSGNTGIALAMAAAMRGFRMILVLPEHLSLERRQTMRAFGAHFFGGVARQLHAAFARRQHALCAVRGHRLPAL
ncbi:MAG: pyridoxal-phosphate dependent enzyme, partial [Casimicrobiaceae bacterium]